MTLSSLRLRAVVGTIALCMTVGGISLAGLATAAGACPTYTDPAGDGVLAGDPSGETQDDNLDILAVSHSVDADVFTSAVMVKKLLATGPNFSFYDRFLSTFTVDKKVVEIRADRDNTGDAPVITGSLRVAATLTTAKVTVGVDVKTNTVTIGIAVPDLEKAVGSSLGGQAFSAMSSKTTQPMTPPVATPAATVQLNLAADTAAAAATSSYVFGGSCSGGTPAPGPSVTPTPTPPPAPVDPLLAQPRAGCALFKDAAGDALPGRAPLSGPNDPDLDLTEVAMKSEAEAVKIFAKVAKLGSPSLPIFTGHKFTAAFSVGGKPVTLSATGAGPATATPATVKATAVFDNAKSNVVFTVPKADLVTVLAAPLAEGTPITNLTLTTNATNPAGTFDGDTAVGVKPEEKAYAVGDNTCFLPPSGKLSLSGATSGVFTDTATVLGTLVDEDDATVEGATLRLVLTGQPPVLAETDEDGIATFVVPMKSKAGSLGLSVQFNGNADVGPAGAGLPFTVLPEASVLTATAGKGTATATLLDNDRTPIVGQLVSFTVGSKVTKVKTNAKGVAVLTKQVSGSTAKVGFAAVPAAYTAAKTVSVKVG